MTEMSGRELLQRIRSTPRTAGMPVVIATAFTPELMAEASEAGVSAFLSRPFGMHSLDEVLRIFIGKPALEGQSSPTQRTFVS
jgi:CheY-like chemotaxis protein